MTPKLHIWRSTTEARFECGRRPDLTSPVFFIEWSPHGRGMSLKIVPDKICFDCFRETFGGIQ